MSLEELVDNSRTDKNTTHSYLPLYQHLLQSKKETAKNVLEVGVQRGGSIKLWRDFFPNATVYGIDSMQEREVSADLKNDSRVVVLSDTDAYNVDFFNSFYRKNIKFDFLLDDGPHTLESIYQFIEWYTHLMAADGLFVIENVACWDWINILRNAVAEPLKPFIKVYDLRANKNQYNDIVFTIDKSNGSPPGAEALRKGICYANGCLPKLNLHDSTLLVAFIAHSMDIVETLNRDYVQPHILFVGAKPFHATENPNVVVVRDLPHHIEDKWRLLTFTAWYAVAKNNLYPNHEHFCLLEYDAHVCTETFVQQVKEAAPGAVVGFMKTSAHFFSSIRPEVVAGFLGTKGIDPALYGASFEWMCTTNLCMPRAFLLDFVDWYDYEYLMQHDDANLPYYHERLAAVFTSVQKYPTNMLAHRIKHDQKNSHSQ